MKSEFLKRTEQAAKAEAEKRQAAGGSGTNTPPPAGATPLVPPVAATPPPVKDPTLAPPPEKVEPIGAAAPPPEKAEAPAAQPQAGAAAAPPVAGHGVEDPQVLEFLKSRGIEVSNIDELVQRYNQPAPAKELTEEEKKKQEQERELRLLKEFQDEGGTMDDFYRLRRLGDVGEENLVREHFKTQMRELHPTATEEQLDDAFNRQFFIGEDYAAHETEYGKKKLALEAEALKKSQLQPLSKVENQLSLKDEARKAAQEWGQKIDTFTQSMPTSFEIPLGKVGETDLGVLTYNLSDDEKRELVSDMKDPAYILRELQDKKTGKTDPAKLFELLKYKKLAEKMIRTAATANYSKGIETVVKPLENFPNLGRSTQSSGVDQSDATQQGVTRLKQDSRNILGGSNNTRKKSLK